MQVRNCRLGMLAMLGFAVQAWVTGKGPIDNAIDHLKDPWGQNGWFLQFLHASFWFCLCLPSWLMEQWFASTCRCSQYLCSILTCSCRKAEPSPDLVLNGLCMRPCARQLDYNHQQRCCQVLVAAMPLFFLNTAHPCLDTMSFSPPQHPTFASPYGPPHLLLDPKAVMLSTNRAWVLCQ